MSSENSSASAPDSDTLDKIWESIETMWGVFDIEQIIGSMCPHSVFQKAAVLAQSRKMHDLFFIMLWSQLTEQERKQLVDHATVNKWKT